MRRSSTGLSDRIRAHSWWWLLALVACSLPALAPLPVEQRVMPFLARAAVGVLAVAASIALHRPRHRAPWILLAAALTANFAGDVLWYRYSVVLQVDPFPSAADVAYLAAYPLLGAALVLLARRRRAAFDLPSLIDASVVTVGVGVLVWVFLAVPLATDPALTALERVVSVGYPLGDLLLLALTARLVMDGGLPTPALRLLGAGLLVMMVTNAGFAIATLTGQDFELVLDHGWLANYALCGAAALHPSMAAASLPSPGSRAPLTRYRLLLLTVAALLAPAALLVQTVRDEPVQGVAIGVGSAALFLLVVLRMAGLLRQLREQSDELAALVLIDPLTGASNRRGWQETLVRELARSSRDHSPVCVALLDLDHFKHFNDRHGHPEGDVLLRACVTGWRALLRVGDGLARYGGEEFAVVLPDATPAAAAVLVERLRSTVPGGQTASAGIACWDEVETADELVARADRALYEAKDRGRDRAVTDDGGAPAPTIGALRSAARTPDRADSASSLDRRPA